MFCYQCEQTAQGTGCTTAGVCGKDAETAQLQDLLLYMTQGIAMYAHRAKRLGVWNAEIPDFVVTSLFTTVTNVDFDASRIEATIRKAEQLRNRARVLYEEACRQAGQNPESLTGPATAVLAGDRSGLIRQAESIGINDRSQRLGEEATGLHELVIYGLKGAAAYVDHARILGQEDQALLAFFLEALDYIAQEPTDTAGLLGMALRVGENNLRAMELLDAANTGAFGDPVPTAVRITPLKGKAILVSGHDLKDLDMLLRQTEGRGIQIYTHGEMLPAHGYPGLKRFAHLAGNYGGAWQNQRQEFAQFPGAILMTTNCIQRPKADYQGRIFTTGLVAWPGVQHIGENAGRKDFTAVIDAALASPGFAGDGPDQFITVGFGHKAVLSAADKIVSAVRSGKIKHFYLIGGCDGAKPGRNYYTDLAQAVPKDAVILTLACGKFRFNTLDFGSIEGIPRLLDIGQCNDAYSAIQIALALSQAFQTPVNSLPLSIILSWYEQKAVAILLTLLHLGITNLRLGPSLPAFVTPGVLGILAEKFKIRPISTPAEDLAASLTKA
jgi:hydroxylamine reductase